MVDLSTLTMDQIELKVASLDNFEKALVKLIGKEGLAGIEGGLETNLPSNEPADMDETLDISHPVFLIESAIEVSSSNALQVLTFEVSNNRSIILFEKF